MLKSITSPPEKGTWLEKIINSKDSKNIINELSDIEADILLKDWLYNSRREQYEPQESWNTWMFCAGRGAGKTRAGAEWVVDNAMKRGLMRQALVAPTSNDLTKVMIRGDSGILSVCPDATFNQKYNTVLFPNGAIAEGFSAEKPDRLRGPQFHAAWCDELTSWKYDQETWDMLQFGLRLGKSPRCFISTTPKPRPLFKSIYKDDDTVITTGSTYDNMSNLSSSFIDKIKKKYDGTRLGRQELLGMLIEDSEDALWSRSVIEYSRRVKLRDLTRVVIGVDPAATSKTTSDETGIVVCGTDGEKGYVLDDFTLRGKPSVWAKEVEKAFYFYDANYVVVESNNGGEMAAEVISQQDKIIPIKLVHASKGKRARAEPISMLYEQGRISHAKILTELEDEMCSWDSNSNESPNRIDAMVWGMSFLMCGSLFDPADFYSQF